MTRGRSARGRAAPRLRSSSSLHTKSTTATCLITGDQEIRRDFWGFLLNQTIRQEQFRTRHDVGQLSVASNSQLKHLLNFWPPVERQVAAVCIEFAAVTAPGSLQRVVLPSSLHQDRDVGVGVLPEGEDVLVLTPGGGDVSAPGFGTREPQAADGAKHGWFFAKTEFDAAPERGSGLFSAPETQQRLAAQQRQRDEPLLFRFKRRERREACL